MGCNHSVEDLPNKHQKTRNHSRSNTFSSGIHQSNDFNASSFNKILEIYDDTYKESQKLRESLDIAVCKAEQSIGIFNKAFYQFNRVFSKKNLQNYNRIEEEFVCVNCDFEFNMITEKPVELPCEHTLCLKCLLQDYEQNGTITCIIDKTEFDVDPTHLPINHNIFSFVGSCDAPLYCEIHMHPITKFCAKDKELLCGECEIDHLGHSLLDLKSSDLAERSKIEELISR